MKTLLFAALLLMVSPGFSAPPTAPKKVALSFDDCHRRTGTLMNGMERARKLTKALKDAKTGPVVFFCNSPSRQPDGLERLKLFSAEGHLIANHTATHPDLYKTSVADFTREIETAHDELKDLPGFRKWFRFPYLHEGKTPEAVNGVRDLQPNSSG